MKKPSSRRPRGSGGPVQSFVLDSRLRGNDIDYSTLATEQINPRSRKLDKLSSLQIVSLMNSEDQNVIRAIARSRGSIAKAVDLIVRQLKVGGRIIFVGAGTSGRLGVIEAAECPPTFGTKPELVQGIMAGGSQAVFKSKEGSEDSEKDGRVQVNKRTRAQDVVIGIAASGVTPFVRAALNEAKRRKAKTILVTCNPAPIAGVKPDLRITLPTGPEVLAGSTRLKAGSACKMALNILTTASFTRMGKVMGNRMVDLQPKSKKLVARGIRLVQELAKVTPARAEQLFKQAKGHVKTAILFARQ